MAKRLRTLAGCMVAVSGAEGEERGGRRAVAYGRRGGTKATENKHAMGAKRAGRQGRVPALSTVPTPTKRPSSILNRPSMGVGGSNKKEAGSTTTSRLPQPHATTNKTKLALLRAVRKRYACQQAGRQVVVAKRGMQPEARANQNAVCGTGNGPINNIGRYAVRAYRVQRQQVQTAGTLK